jgi:hypothetical protein
MRQRRSCTHRKQGYWGSTSRIGTDVVRFSFPHMLLGLIEKAPERVLIVRLTRHTDITSPHVLNSASLAGISRDPLLRFSRALDGIFHEGVVVCEGDTDSQFYSSVASRDRGDASPPPMDIMFTSAGGKQRIPLIARSLCALGVPVRVVVDFDALNDTNVLRALVESVGGTYRPEWERDRQVVDSHIRGSESPLKAGLLHGAITTILEGDPESLVTRHMLSEIREAIQPSAGWRAAKKRGKSAVPSGEATVALERLLDQLSTVGIHVVPGGAVESFVKTVGGKSTEWLTQVIEQNLISSATDAHAFVDSLLKSLRS